MANPVSPALPLNSWVYPALDKLTGLGLIDSSLQGSRPYDRLEAARLTAEARTSAKPGSSQPVVEELLGRLEAELHEQLVELGFADGVASPGYLKPLRSIEAHYFYRDGEDALVPGTNARQFPLNYNNFGIDYEEHHNGQLTFEGDARLAGVFLLQWRPLLLIDEDDTSFRLLQGTAALALGPLELSAGRQSLWWGQGRHGSLVLTNNARPLDMIRITNPTPVDLPWLFNYLGPFRFDVFWSQLEENRIVPEPYFAGLRLNFKPHPCVEIGASRTVLFGGDGRPDVDWEDFFTILGGKNLEGEEDNSNSVAALDARLRLPFLWNAEIYGELGGEDEAGGFISNKAWLAGLYLPMVESTQRLSLRLEYAALDHVDSNSPIWYRHGIYQSGYTYHEQIMGHHVGGGGSDLFTEITAILSGDLTLGLSFDYERRGVDQATEEEHYQPGIALEWKPHARLTFNARYAFNRVENFNFVSGNDLSFHFVDFGLTSNW